VIAAALLNWLNGWGAIASYLALTGVLTGIGVWLARDPVADDIEVAPTEAAR